MSPPGPARDRVARLQRDSGCEWRVQELEVSTGGWPGRFGWGQACVMPPGEKIRTVVRCPVSDPQMVMASKWWRTEGSWDLCYWPLSQGLGKRPVLL